MAKPRNTRAARIRAATALLIRLHGDPLPSAVAKLSDTFDLRTLLALNHEQAKTTCHWFLAGPNGTEPPCPHPIAGTVVQRTGSPTGSCAHHCLAGETLGLTVIRHVPADIVERVGRLEVKP